MMKKYVLLGLLVFSALLVFAWSRKPKYEEVSPRRGDVTEAIYGLGKVKSDQRFEIKLGVVGTIRQVFVREGDAVKKGDRLLDIDDAALIRSPIDGVVTMLDYFAGESVMPQIPLLRVEDLSHRFIEVSLEQEGALRVKKGQRAKVVFESLRSEALTGEVITLFPKNDEFLAHVRVDNLKPSILPGMTADVSIEIGDIKNALLIPVKAINNGMVAIVRNGKKAKVKVEVGHIDGSWAEIKSGIDMNDAVVVPRGI